MSESLPLTFMNEAGEKFCGGCGRSLTATARPVEPRLTLPEAYTPKHLAAKILTSKAALEGERKHVTVLFADLKGSMELLADRDPEEARKILDPVLELMMEAVHRYEGTVNQVMGDGIMALFGTPLAHEDHAVRACDAALRKPHEEQVDANDSPHSPRKRRPLTVLCVAPRTDHQRSSRISFSACSSQNRMSMSRYIVVALVRCSCACSRWPVRR